MKNNLFLMIITAFMICACGNNKSKFDASGVFEATEVIVSADGTGEIMMFDVTEGQDITENELVGYIDTTQLHLKRQELLANLKSAGSKYNDVPNQVASLKQQIATQQRELRRYENLVRSNAGNQKQVDDINSDIAVLQKQLSAQTETLENSNVGVSGETLGLNAKIAQIEDQISKCRITSPIKGTVLSKYAEMGELATPGSSLFKIADINNMFIRAYITADQITSLKIGQHVGVYADQGKSGRKEYDGVVTWISDKAEFTPKTIQTRDERANLVYAVKIAVINDGYIKSGMYGDIKIK